MKAHQKNISLVASAAALLTAAATLPASAASFSSAGATTPRAATGEQTVQVQWRHGGRWHGHGGWGRGVGPFLGGLAAGAIVGGALSGPTYRSYDGDYYDDGYYGYDGSSGDAVARCSAQFRSFNPATGTYTTYGGETRTCPYLR